MENKITHHITRSLIVPLLLSSRKYKAFYLRILFIYVFYFILFYFILFYFKDFAIEHNTLYYIQLITK
jgi:hypothetical protein